MQPLPVKILGNGFLRKELMTIERLIIGLALVTFNLLLSGTVRADELPAVNLPQLNTSSESSPGLGNSGDSPQAIRAAKHQLYLPSKTPLPLEGYRWPATHLKIYLATRNQPLMTAFRDAVKAWNSTGVVDLTWTRHRCQADIIAETGDLSASQATPEVGGVYHPAGLDPL